MLCGDQRDLPGDGASFRGDHNQAPPVRSHLISPAHDLVGDNSSLAIFIFLAAKDISVSIKSDCAGYREKSPATIVTGVGKGIGLIGQESGGRVENGDA